MCLGEEMQELTAPEDELLEILDHTGRPTGESKSRQQVHQDGDWHRCLHVWIVRERSNLLVQRRSKAKTIEPFKLDVTVGGHFRYGEDIAAALREVEEEVGLYVKPADIHYLHTQQVTRYYPDQGLIDSEFQEVYWLHHDQPLNAYFPHPQELYALYEVPLQGFIQLYEQGGSLPARGWDTQARDNHALLVPEDLVVQARAETLATLKALQAALAEASM